MIKAAATVLVLVAAFAATINAQEPAPPVGAQKAPSITEKLTTAVKTVTGDPLSKADYDMRRVLDVHAEL